MYLGALPSFPGLISFLFGNVLCSFDVVIFLALSPNPVSPLGETPSDHPLCIQGLIVLKKIFNIATTAWTYGWNKEGKDHVEYVCMSGKSCFVFCYLVPSGLSESVQLEKRNLTGEKELCLYWITHYTAARFICEAPSAMALCWVIVSKEEPTALETKMMLVGGPKWPFSMSAEHNSDARHYGHHMENSGFNSYSSNF